MKNILKKINNFLNQPIIIVLDKSRIIITALSIVIMMSIFCIIKLKSKIKNQIEFAKTREDIDNQEIKLLSDIVKRKLNCNYKDFNI